MSTQHDSNTTYQILIEGQIGTCWADWFEGMDISHNEQGFTVLTGLVADQAELQGILSTIGMLNMTLISVAQIDVKSTRESQTILDEKALSD